MVVSRIAGRGYGFTGWETVDTTDPDLALQSVRDRGKAATYHMGRGGHRAASIYSLVKTAKLNGVDPKTCMTDTISRIADHPARRVAELLLWNYRLA